MSLIRKTKKTLLENLVNAGNLKFGFSGKCKLHGNSNKCY